MPELTVVAEHRFDNVLMGWQNDLEGNGYTVVMPDVRRATSKRLQQVAHRLFGFAGFDPARWDQVNDAERERYSRTRVGRYAYLEIKVYDDDTVIYNTPSSGGVGSPLASWLVIDHDLEIIPIGGS